MYFYLYSAYFVWRSVVGTRINDDIKIVDIMNTSFKEVENIQFLNC